MTIDPHGRYLAIGTRQTTLHFFNRFGRPAGSLETMHSLSHLCFVPGRPMAVAAAAFGTMVGVAFEIGRTQGRLDPEIIWQDRLLSNVGRLALDGEGGMILASCYTLGIQRFDLRGRNEGSYHLGGTVSHAVPDFPGRTIATATLEGELAVINSAGNVRWRTSLPRPVVALEVDPLGRYLIYGHSTGEIVRLDLFGGKQSRPAAAAIPRPAAASGQTSGGAAGSVRTPDWLIPVVETEQQSETAVITVVDDPPAIALFTSPHRLQLFDTKGKKLGQGPDSSGVGRILRTAAGWLAAATDRQIVLCDLTQQLLHATRHQLGAAHSPGHQARRLRTRFGPGTRSHRQASRAQVDGSGSTNCGFPSKTWRSALRGSRRSPPAAASSRSSTPPASPPSAFTVDPTDPPLLIEAPEGSPPGVTWVSLARRAQWLRGHNLRGEVVWDRQIPWEGWSLVRLGRFAVVASADGRALACDGSGAIHGQGSPTEDSNSVFTTSAEGEILRISRHGVHLIGCNHRRPRPLACRHRAARRPNGLRAAGHRCDAGQIARLVQERSRCGHPFNPLRHDSLFRYDHGTAATTRPPESPASSPLHFDATMLHPMMHNIYAALLPDADFVS